MPDRPKFIRALEVLLSGRELEIQGYRVALSENNELGVVMTRTVPGQEPVEELYLLDWSFNHVIKDLEKIPDEVLTIAIAEMVIDNDKQKSHR